MADPEESDAIVLTQISVSAKARGIAEPILMSTDQRLVRAGDKKTGDARFWKIDIRLPTNAPANKPKGGGGGGGGSGRIPPGVGTITVTPGRGAANAGAAFLVFQIVDALCNYLTNIFLRQEVKAQINQSGASIRSWQRQTRLMVRWSVSEFVVFVPTTAWRDQEHGADSSRRSV